MVTSEFKLKEAYNFKLISYSLCSHAVGQPRLLLWLKAWQYSCSCSTETQISIIEIVYRSVVQ